MVFAFKEGVVNVEPVATILPPDTTVYQLYVPPGAVAVNVAAVFAQMVAGEGVTVGATGIGFTLTSTGVLVLLVQFDMVAST